MFDQKAVLNEYGKRVLNGMYLGGGILLEKSTVKIRILLKSHPCRDRAMLCPYKFTG